MHESETVLTDSQAAWRVIGQALWRTICRANGVNEAMPECLTKLMDAYALTEEEGSVCIQYKADSEEILSEADVAFLCEKKLLTRKPLSLEQAPDPLVPFVLDDTDGLRRLYMQRHFMQERAVALKILALIQDTPQTLSPAVQKALTTFNGMQYGKPSPTDETSRLEQQGAVARALERQFFIITGGPGTGKTTVVAKLLECLLIDRPNLKIALAAPTGKAAARIMQSLVGSCEQFSSFFPNLVHLIRDESLPAQTIHKWLLTRNKKGKIPDQDNPLDIDVMIVDEASMIDLHLADRLLSVIDARRTRLILLGDKYQLSAVGPGSVLADMTSENGALSSNLAELTISHRFTHDSNVGVLAQAIKTAEADFDCKAFIKRFKNASEGKDKVSIHLYKSKNPVDPALVKWLSPHLNAYLKALQDYLDDRHSLIEDDSKLIELWKCAESFRVLAAQRVGHNGVNAVNDFIENRIREQTHIASNSLFYPGRLVIIRQNTPSLDVYNGDVGIVLPLENDPERYELYIGDRNKRIPVGLLPQHDTAFTMTIHQSQGSQFANVAVLLPMAEDSPLACRELFYTAVTRAQDEAAIFGTAKSIERSVLVKTQRASGLADRLAEK